MRIFQSLTLLIAFIVLSASMCDAQNWKQLNPPLNIFNGFIYSTALDTSGNIYAAGDFTNNNFNRFVAKWDGISWKELGSGASSLNANNTILTLTVSPAGEVYAAGGFIDSAGYTYVSKWNGSTWSELGNSSSALNANGLIYSIAVDKNGNVYAAGGFTNAAGEYYVAKWNGSTWNELGTGSSALHANNAIFAITTDTSGNVYAGGYFTNASGKEYVAKWDGTTWNEPGTGANALNANDFINSLATDNQGNVYAAGAFRSNNGDYYIAKWNGSTWSEVGAGAGALHANSTINSIVVKNENEIYAAGDFTDAGGTCYVANWNGVSWTEINNLQQSVQANNQIQTISVDVNRNIYAAGKFTNESSHAFVAKWNGSGWAEPGSKGNPFYTYQPIYQVVGDSSGNVYVSGSQQDAGGRYYLEHWNGGDWQKLGIADTSQLFIFLTNPVIIQSNLMAVDKKGNLYVTGRRQVTNGNNYDCVLKWDGKQWSILEDKPNALHSTNQNGVYNDIHELEFDRYGNLYANGYFVDSANLIHNLAKWDGNKWTLLPGTIGDISKFCVGSDSVIYAYGGFTNEFGNHIIISYKLYGNENWKELRNGNNRFSFINPYNINMVIDSKDSLYVSGDLMDSANNQYLEKWDGNNWSKFGTTRVINSPIVIDKDDNLYASGAAETSRDSRVKKWNGTAWASVGGPIIDYNDGPQAQIILSADYLGNLYSEGPTGTHIVKYSAVNIAKRPHITSFSPKTGSLGTQVTITGNGFGNTSNVLFGGTEAALFNVVNDSTIIATVSTGSTGNILVETIAGSDSLGTFTFTCDSIKEPVPVLYSFADTMLRSSPSLYYKWFLNNKVIPDENNNTIHVDKTGFYHVATSTDGICFVPSSDYPILISTTPLNDSLKVSVYPNPSSGTFTVDVKLPQTTTVSAYVKIYDVNGTQVLQTNKLIFFGNEIRIPITSNTRGTFFVKVFVNSDDQQQTIIIQ